MYSPFIWLSDKLCNTRAFELLRFQHDDNAYYLCFSITTDIKGEKTLLTNTFDQNL